MKILVTGGAGFIGSNFIRHILRAEAGVEVVNLDALTYAGNLENLVDVEADSRYQFVRADLRDAETVDSVFAQHVPDAVLNFAAESHVDRSLHYGVEDFIATNIGGTQHVLDAVREHGVGRFVQVSTDEVYGSLGEQEMFSEFSPIAPNNPYAATKAGADFLVRAAQRSYGMHAIITRCSNNYGPYQFPEKLIPLMIGNALGDKPLPVYGDGLHVRDWIHVEDHCSAIHRVLQKGKSGEIYNIGSMHGISNLQVIRQLLAHLGKPESLITHVEDRPGHDRRYAMDAGKIRMELGWESAYPFEEGLKGTIDWYLENRAWLDNVRSGDYVKYYESMYSDR